MDNVLFFNRHEYFFISKSKGDLFHDLLPIVDALFPYISNKVTSFYEENQSLDVANTPASTSNKISDEQFINDVASTNEDISIFLNIIIRLLSKCDSLTLGVEYFYIDRDYRDSYYMHYSEKHKETDRYCTRVMLFSGDFFTTIQNERYNKKQYKSLQDNFVGSVVLTPLSHRCIGRSLLNPLYFFNNDSAFVRTTSYSIYFKGYKFKVFAFPFRMQDTITTTCAEVTVINILDYYSRSYSDYGYFTPSAIHQIAKQEKFDRHIPSGGLTYELISRILYRAGLAPKFYLPDKIDDTSIRHLISYYIESGIPVAIGTSPDNKEKKQMGHSIVCIGHGKCNLSLQLVTPQTTPQLKVEYINSADLYDEWIVQDDVATPYCVYSFDKTKKANKMNRREGDDKYIAIDDYFGRKKIDCIVAPLYKRMYMDAIKAEDTILSILDDDERTPKPYLDGSPVIYRLFLASSRHLKSFRISNIRSKQICRLYQEVPLPQFVWVCELFTRQGYKCQKAFGEILLDATYSGPNLLESCLMINYPDRHIAQFFDLTSSFYSEDSEGINIVPKEALDFVDFKGVNEFSAYSNLQHDLDFRKT